MAWTGFRKAVAVCFLILALPGVGVALWGEYNDSIFLHFPNHDAWDDPAGARNYYPRLWEEFCGLTTLLILGLALVPGYLCQVLRPSRVPRCFWPVSSGYNLLLLLVYGAYTFGMGTPPATLFIPFAIICGIPLLGLCLSLACAMKQRPSLA